MKGQFIYRCGSPFPSRHHFVRLRHHCAGRLKQQPRVLGKIKDGIFAVRVNYHDNASDIYCMAEKPCEILMMDAKSLPNCTGYANLITFCNAALRLVSQKKSL